MIFKFLQLKMVFKTTILFFVFFFAKTVTGQSFDYGWEKIDPILRNEIENSNETDDLHHILVVMTEQYNHEMMQQATRYMDKQTARKYVMKEMTLFTAQSQYDVVNMMRNQKANAIKNINSFWIFNGFVCDASVEVIEMLAQRDDIGIIYSDKKRNMIPDGEDSQPVQKSAAGNAWNVEQVNADDVWVYNNEGYTGDGVVVAVIDTGVNYNHTDITDNMWDGGDSYPHHGYDFVNDDADPIDDNGHGTHCAGTVAGYGTNGTQTGIAKGAKIMALKVLNDKGNGNSEDIINAIQFAVEHDADILSLSLGASGVGGFWGYRRVMEMVMSAGVVAAVAAGNDGDELTKYPVPNNVVAPGNCPPPWLNPDQTITGGTSATISVGATNQSDQKTSFSSIGPVTWNAGEYIGEYKDYPYTPDNTTEIGLIRPDVAAPGYYIISLNYSDNTGYCVKNGTSMATPCVAGVIALMLEAAPNLSPADIDMILEITAVRCEGATTKNNRTGSGRVDALASIQAIKNVFEDVTVGDLKYTINKSAKTAIVTGHNGTSVDGVLTIPSSVTYKTSTYSVNSICDKAFEGCDNIRAIRVECNEPPTIYPNTFNGVDKSIAVFVPCEKPNDYRAADYWSEFTVINDSPYNLVVTKNDDYGGEASVVKYAGCNNNQCSVMAQTYIGYTFDGWYVNDIKVSAELSYSFQLGADVVCEARFNRKANHSIANGITNTWNNPDTWYCGGIPTSSSTVSVWNDITVDANASVSQMGIYNNTTITILPDVILTVTGDLITENPASIVIENGGQLVHSCDGVSATVKKSIDAYTSSDDGWNLIAFPLAGKGDVSSVQDMLSNKYDLYYYDESNKAWMNHKETTNNFTELFSGKGYLYANQGDGNMSMITMAFAGELENGAAEVVIPLDYTAGNKLSGFNLIGNPFVHNVENYNATNVADGCFRVNEAKTNLIVSTISELKPLKPAEGFFVKATGENASVTFNLQAKDEKETKGMISLELLQNNVIVDRFIVKEDCEALNKISLRGKHTEIYAKDDDEKYAVLPFKDNVLPVCFKAKEMGLFTIRVEVEELNLSYLHLIDNFTGDDIDMLLEQAYTFHAAAVDDENRFSLVFYSDSAIDDNDVFAYQHGEEIIVNGEGELQMFDIMGRSVLTMTVSGADKVSASCLQDGLYILRIVNGNDVKTQKIVVK